MIKTNIEGISAVTIFLTATHLQTNIFRETFLINSREKVDNKTINSPLNWRVNIPQPSIEILVVKDGFSVEISKTWEL